ncbi:MAG: hypothetical protein RL226_2415 [Bacteroidota bacterium]|jgi:hypothetical protein
MTLLSIHIASSSELLIAEQEGGVFHSPALIRAAGENTMRLVVKQSTTCVAFFNVQRLSLKGIPSLANPRLHPHMALFMTHEGKQAVAMNDVVAAVFEWLNNRPEWIIDVALPPDIDARVQLPSRKWKLNHKLTYRIILTGDPTAQISKKRKQLIKQAVAAHATVQTVQPQEALRILQLSAEAKGFTVQTGAVSELGSASNAKFLGTTIGNSTIAAGVFVADASVFYYLMGGADRNANAGGMSLLLHEALLLAQKQGCQVFDFEGSMIPGVATFFKSFGGEPTQYMHLTKAALWWRMLLRMRGRQEF